MSPLVTSPLFTAVVDTVTDEMDFLMKLLDLLPDASPAREAALDRLQLRTGNLLWLMDQPDFKFF